MDPSFGARLRTQREEQQVALVDIAEQTKIKLSLLESLERDDVSHWPSGIFRRSYIRAYARAIGLDPDVTLREFLEQHPEPVEDLQTAIEAVRAAEAQAAQRRPPMRLRYLIDSAMSALPALLLQPNAKSNGAEKPAVDTDTAAVIEPPMDVAPEPSHPFRPAPEPEEEPESFPDPAAVLGAADQPPVAEPAMALRAEPERPPAADVNLTAVAQLCTRLGRALAARDVVPVLGDAARLLDAVGVILWMWDPRESMLQPVLTHGYPEEMVAGLPHVSGDTDTAIAAAFRARETRVVNGSELDTGAVVAPLLTPGGCAGVLALELRHGGEQRESVRASATILAAQLSFFAAAPSLDQAATA
jgi:hypothetical protein